MDAGAHEEERARETLARDIVRKENEMANNKGP